MADPNIIATVLVATALSKPATKLIETLSRGCGTLYEPKRIRRMASANADAQIILAKADVEIQDIESRAAARIDYCERRRQQNIEAIAQLALDAMPEQVSEQPVDEDWIHQFFNQCQDIGNEEMRKVWAKLLAGEVTQPGSFSLRSLQTVRVLQKQDAEFFNRFCIFLWQINGAPVPIIYLGHDDLIWGEGKSVRGFKHLQDIGLINYEAFQGLSVIEESGQFLVSYYDKQYQLQLPEQQTDLTIGPALLTDIGKELAPLTSSQPDEQYHQSILEEWRKKNIEVVKLPTNTPTDTTVS